MARLRTRWPTEQRRQFILCLTDTASPQAAARLVGRTLFDAYGLKDADPAFAADWERAISIAWQCVECRVIAELIAPDEDEGAGGPRSRKASRFLDTKLALALVQTRHQGSSMVQGQTLQGAAVEGLRDEIRRLASENVQALSGAVPPRAAKPARKPKAAKATANGSDAPARTPGNGKYLNGNGHSN